MDRPRGRIRYASMVLPVVALGPPRTRASARSAARAASRPAPCCRTPSGPCRRTAIPPVPSRARHPARAPAHRPPPAAAHRPAPRWPCGGSRALYRRCRPTARAIASWTANRGSSRSERLGYGRPPEPDDARCSGLVLGGHASARRASQILAPSSLPALARLDRATRPFSTNPCLGPRFSNATTKTDPSCSGSTSTVSLSAWKLRREGLPAAWRSS